MQQHTGGLRHRLIIYTSVKKGSVYSYVSLQDHRDLAFEHREIDLQESRAVKIQA